MKILKINPNRPEKELIRLAADVIKKGGIVIYPTDTLYGIAANALSKKCVVNVYKIKGRKFTKPLSVAFHSLQQAKRYVKFDKVSTELARKFLPGPLTIILPMKYKFPKELTGGSKSVGVRLPDNKIALEMIRECGFPVTSTSANVSGNGDPITAEDAVNQVGDKVDMILDGGKCRHSKPSTIVDASSGKIKILREGAIKGRTLSELVGI
ncbi:MAG: threonylcarbamoyl-AMP synthase [Candidatus Aenigmarchaeota archaeon]|nr:threonylcarbamoyl-AMP synthase [Candidatus Aenigmarchaeota archaeon]